MAAKALTDKAIEKAAPAPAGKRIELWDSMVPGFGVRISDKGTKTFMVMTRVNGALRRFTIGRYGVMSLADAREEARDTIINARKGIDAKKEREAAQREAAESDERRFSRIARDFVLKYHVGITAPKQLEKFATLEDVREKADEVEKLVSRPRNASWRNEARKLLKYVFPTWKDRDIATIKRKDVAKLLDSVSSNHGPIMANRTLATVRKLFNWAMLQPALIDVLEASPIVPGMAPGVEQEKDRFLSAEEIPIVWSGAEAVGYPFGAAALMMLVTGQRREEVGGMRREDVDFERRIWTVPKDSTKARRRHEVMLSDLAIKLLQDVPKIGDEWFFTSTGEAPISGWSKAKDALDAQIAAALAKKDAEASMLEWTYHDLRRTMATHLEDTLGISKPVVSAILNHAESGATKVYTKGELRDHKLAAMQAWGRYLDKLLGRQPDNVVDLASAR